MLFRLSARSVGLSGKPPLLPVSAASSAQPLPAARVGFVLAPPVMGTSGNLIRAPFGWVQPLDPHLMVSQLLPEVNGA